MAWTHVEDRRTYHREYSKKWRQENPEKAAAAWNRAYKKRKTKHHADPRHKMLVDARGRARRKNLEFNISLEDFSVPECCPVLGIKLSVGDKSRHDGSPTLDRIDNSKGYVKGNVEVISWRANHLKSDATTEEIRCLYHYYVHSA